MTNTKQQNKKSKQATFKWLLLILTILAIIVGLSWPTNYYIEMPGEAVATNHFIKSQKKVPPNFYLVTVSETSQPASVLEYLLSYTQKFATRVPKDELLGNATNSQYQELQKWYMQTSQQNAIYYAAKRARLRPKLNYEGVYVMQVQKNSSFKNKLKVGDTVLGADHYNFHSTAEMMSYFQKKKIGTKVKIKVLRNQKYYTFSGKIVRVAGTGKAGIGIQLVEHIKVTTKPKLKIDAGEIGGPSAGLMFTLTSYEIFTQGKLAKGHKIAGTGTVTPDGKVGVIGGVDKKVVAADKAGAEVFFAPTDTSVVKQSESNYVVAKKTAQKIGTKMKIVPVRTVDDAINYLTNNY
ncbi:SepM family pheromone-processing serine protease [Lactobacillus bombicola]|uniref:endopeptidase La n=1 Tax=Lactobacillus bombicola TaxID=1505723 RepID=A0A396SSF0_9LACO|nr:SepM family pheromone-processing serine protease [Lactobacillus bombicola]RHW50456.1 PDZ domain-containing protein [Lactobacillus bombicola]RHW54566.1 PDZ domain-containing protein [Lactobacillus bombicola]